MEGINEQAGRLMEGACDVHMHASPCIQHRRKTIYEIALEGKANGMKGCVLKDHNVSTAPIASVVNEVVPGFEVIGGITLAASNGGVNPAAVENTFQLGGRVVWMFSLESAWMFERIRQPDFKNANNYKALGVGDTAKGYTIFKEPGVSETLSDEAREIVALCKQYDAVLETSHLSPKEGCAIFREACAQGVRKFVVTHANQDITNYTLQQQTELAQNGAVIMYCMAQYMSKPFVTGEDLIGLRKFIRTVGCEHVVLGTDFGLSIWPSAIEGMRMMIAGLLSMEFTPEEIRYMTHTLPQSIYFDR